MSKKIIVKAKIKKVVKKKVKKERPVIRAKSVSNRTVHRVVGSPGRRVDGSEDYGFRGMPPLGIVLYGPSGVGKTSFAAQFPSPLFIVDSQEEGIRDLVAYRQVKKPIDVLTVTSFTELLGVCRDVRKNYPNVRTVIFDSLTGMELLCFKYHCETYFNNDWSAKGFFSFFRGPRNAAKTDWPDFLGVVEFIRQLNINVILIGHSVIKAYSNPEGSDYDRFNVYLDKETWAATHRWAQAVFFLNFYTEILKEEGDSRTKAKGDIRRFLYPTHSPAYDAKNRFGMDELVSMGDTPVESYANFCKAYDKAISDIPF